MPLLSETLCILAVIACLRAGALGADARAFIGQDSEGDLHVNATTGKKVFVSGVNVREEMEALATLVSAQAELLAETRADLAAARQEFSSIKPRENNIVRPREYIYVIGGAFQSESVIVQRFDGGSWSLAPSLTIPRAFASAATYNGFLYAGEPVCICHHSILSHPSSQIVGGTKFGRAIDAVEEFDGVAWKIVTSLPTPRNSAGAMAYGKGLYVCGGTEVTGHLSKQVHFYNGSVWQTGPSLINWRTFHGMAVYGAFLYAGMRQTASGHDSLDSPHLKPPSSSLVGGLINPHVPDLNAVERFNGVSWAPVFPLNARRTALGAVVFNGILHASKLTY